MSKQQLKIGLLAAVMSAVMVFAVSLPAASALTPRDFTYSTTSHTDRFPGGQKICGDHLCSIHEWGKMKKALEEAQRDPTICKELIQWKSCS
jgi:hypothetical protein